MKAKFKARSISQASDPSRTLWSDFLVFRNSKSDVAINRAAGDFPPHLHEFAEIGFFLSGRATHRIGSFEHQAGVGDFVVAIPGDRHSFSSSSPDFRRLNVQVRRACFEQCLELLRESGLKADLLEGGYGSVAKSFAGRAMLDPSQFSECLRIVQDMEREWLSPEPGFAAALRFKLGSLLLFLLRSLSSADDVSSDEARSRLLSAIALVDKDYARPIQVEELERLAGMGRRTLERAFKAETGLSPKGYILKTRIAWACRLLDKGARIQEAAAACGFREQNYFTRAFKASTGMTPGRYLAGGRGAS